MSSIAKKAVQFNLVAGIIFSIIIFIFIVISLPGIKDIISEAKTTLSCGTDGLSTSIAMVCIGLDTFALLFFALGLSGATYYITNK